MKDFETGRYIQDFDANAEMLEQLQRLKWDIEDYGSISWDEELEYYSNFLQTILSKKDTDTLSDDEKNTIVHAWEKLQLALAAESVRDEISDDSDYLKDDLYDLVGDAIGFLFTKYPELANMYR